MSIGSAALRHPLRQFLLEFFFAWQIKLIFPSVDVGVLGQRDFDQGSVLLLAQHDADGGVFCVRFHETVEVVDVHLHLSKVLMRELPYLQVYENVAAQEPIVEDQIDKEVFFIEGKTFLSCLKEKAFAKFQ